MTEQPARRQLTMLQAGRGVAALLVVLYHMGEAIFADPRFWGVEIDHGLFRFGKQGVAFFFVLSGYIILHAHAGDIGRPERLRGYAIKRLTRIYLPYWAVLLPLIALYLAMPTLGKPAISAPEVMRNSPLLVGPDNHATLAVAWTLFHEIAFYAVFAVLIASRRAGIAVLAAWQGTCLAAAFWPQPVHYLFQPINLLFGMGMAACLATRQMQLRRPALVMAAGGTAFLALGLCLDFAGWPRGTLSSLLFGLASMTFVIGAVGAEQAGQVRAPRLLQVLGDVSYALYLVHFPVLSALAWMFTAAPVRAMIAAPLAYLLMLMACIGAAMAFHRLVEQPALRWRGRLAPARQPPPRTI